MQVVGMVFQTRSRIYSAKNAVTN
ncbi:hypothetical protein [Anaerobutyricum hallii]